MLYAQKTLLPQEKILYYTKPHYMIFYPVFIWLAFAIWFFTKTEEGIFFGQLFLVMSMLTCISSAISYYCSEYVITNIRIIMKVGFIRRRSLEIFLERIEGIFVDQSIIGRILGFGTVVVSGIGGTKNPFFYIPDPIKFRNNVQQQMQARSETAFSSSTTHG